jgi:hypothetical protein
MIEERWSLFKLLEEVKIKLLYLSLSGDPHGWFRSLVNVDRLNWDYLTKAFCIKYYSPLKAYNDRSHIYYFWPRPRESITQSCGRLKNRLHKNPSRGLCKSIILINFYVRVPPY